MAEELTDKTVIVFFITRTTMFLPKDERDDIVAFMTGYEIGRKTDFLLSLSKLLADKYDCPRKATGWNGQIDLYASRTRLSWVLSFKRLMLEVLMEIMESNEKSKSKDLITSKVRGLIAHVHPKVFMIQHRNDDWFSKVWIKGWEELVDLTQSWFKNYWTSKELSVIEKIDIEVNNARNAVLNNEMSQPTSTLSLLAVDFNEIDYGA